MKLDINCITCNINQAIKMAETFNFSQSKKEALMKEVLQYLSSIDYSKSNPEVIGGTWGIITDHIGISDPYKEIKEFYNKEMMNLGDDLRRTIKESSYPFNVALKIAISGNLIDFAARHSFDVEMMKEKIVKVENINLAIDDSEKLYNKLKDAKQLLYLGDNCGEISLDKLFIEQIKKEFPALDIYFGVRGETVIRLKSTFSQVAIRRFQCRNEVSVRKRQIFSF